jgi:uncharacterized protein YqgC (DUF456 family)
VTDPVAVVLLVCCSLAGLLLIPFGLPGLWVIVLAVVGYAALTDFRSIGAWFMGVVIVLALLAEVLEAWLGFKLALRYGGSRRAGWGALLGGLVGAIVGVPVPLIGSVIAGFVGAFAGAALFEYTRARHAQGAAKAGWGAVLGRAMAAAAKMALGVGISVWALFLALR